MYQDHLRAFGTLDTGHSSNWIRIQDHGCTRVIQSTKSLFARLGLGWNFHAVR